MALILSAEAREVEAIAAANLMNGGHIDFYSLTRLPDIDSPIPSANSKTIARGTTTLTTVTDDGSQSFINFLPVDMTVLRTLPLNTRISSFRWYARGLAGSTTLGEALLQGTVSDKAGTGDIKLTTVSGVSVGAVIPLDPLTYSKTDRALTA